MSFTKTIVFFLLFTLTCVCCHPVSGQSVGSGILTLDGLVYGYNYEPSKKLLQKDKQIKVEGVLDNVEVTVKEKGKVYRSTKTNPNGTFSLKIRTDRIYTIEISKAGYTTSFFTFDLTAVPKEISAKGMTFVGAEFILNSYQAKNKEELSFSFGKLFYNSRGQYLDFETAKFLSKKQRDYVNNPVSLMMRSVQKNKTENKTSSSAHDVIAPLKDKTKVQVSEKEMLSETKPDYYYDTISKKVSDLIHRTRLNPESVSESEIQSLQIELEAARIRNKKDKLTARSPGDSLRLKIQEEALTSIELELFSAKKIIELQQSEISTQKKLLILAIAFLLCLLIMLFLIFKFYKQKRKSYLLLKEKNKKIIDSINYASRIQESILPSEAEIKEVLPKSFVYFQPRDVVSGDFYWLSALKEKTIIACVDCTGHGVPGAFMSLIGNTLLNEIVNEREIIDPSEILKRLHLEVVKSLHQNSNRAQSKDGMEMSVCVIDENAKQIAFAGAMNPIYIVQDGIVTLVKPDMKGIGGEIISGKNEEFTTSIIPIVKGMSVYLFTDGYMDQFGGAENKKFNIPNFKNLLIDMQSLEMEKQGEKVKTTIEKWKGNQKQIDDMLVIGIRF